MDRSFQPSDHLLFLRHWFSRPFQTAAIAPSSRWLARAMTAGIEPGQRILELGPGTGSFTQALLKRGVDEADLLLVERNPAFATLLAERFPRARIVLGDAASLPIDDALADAAVSGLPLLSMPAPQVMRILRAAFGRLRPGASFWQFTYGPRCPVPRTVLNRLGLVAHHTRFVPFNLPPASVYRISRLS